MKKIVYSTVFLFTISFSFAYAETFTRTLTLGSRGQDVLILQKILNSNSSTSLTGIGPGSYGLETTYFRERTRQAVIKFQNLYADRILTPVGLPEGTGIVGPSTRDFLNTFIYNHPLGEKLKFTGTSTVPTLREILNMSTSSIPVDSELLSPEELLNMYNNATTTKQDAIYFKGTSTALTFNNILKIGLSTTTPKQLDDIENLIKNNLSGTSTATTTAMTFSGFFPTVKASHPGKYVDGEEFFVGSNSKISDLDFFLGNKKLGKDCIFGPNDYLSEHGCRLTIYENAQPGIYKLSSSNPDLGTQKFTIVNRNIPYPVVKTTNFKVSENNKIIGTGFSKKMKVFTINGQYDVETDNNSFDLKIPNQFRSNFPAMKGPFYVENESGLQSDMSSLITYEK
jgi:peptidoglycan hydrolase-like protein with peptidoglycan-binding domain